MHINSLILLLLASSATAINVSSTIYCNGVVFENEYYDKVLLFEGLGRPYNLLIDKISGDLFFSYTIQNGKKIDFKIRTCELERRVCKNVKGVSGGFAIGYDAAKHDVYFGGHDGIFKYDFKRNRGTLYTEKGKSIWSIFIRNDFYYIQHPSQKLYVYSSEGTFEAVPETLNVEMDNFFESILDERYYSNETGLYKIGKNGLAYLLSNEIEVRQITEDLNGNVYFCASDGVYAEDEFEGKVKKVAHIYQAYSIAFLRKDVASLDAVKNQIIFSDKHAIYVLVKSVYNHLCLKAFNIRRPNSIVEVFKAEDIYL